MERRRRKREVLKTGRMGKKRGGRDNGGRRRGRMEEGGRD